jgi:hypothetical protein
MELPPRIDALRRLATAWNDAWNGRDVAALERFFATPSTFYEPSLAAPMEGAEGIAASASRTWGDWPRAVFEAVSITAEPERVVIEWRTRAAHRSGLTHILEGVDILEVDAALRVTSCRIYYDTRTETSRVSRRR